MRKREIEAAARRREKALAVVDDKSSDRWKLQHTLFINKSDSRCGNCYGMADKDEHFHLMKRMNESFDPNEPITVFNREWKHCGIEYFYVSSDYYWPEAMRADVASLRPDLEWYGYYESMLDRTEL